MRATTTRKVKTLWLIATFETREEAMHAASLVEPGLQAGYQVDVHHRGEGIHGFGLWLRRREGKRRRGG